MGRIHALASVDPLARIADDAEIGPYCVIGGDVRIGPGCRLVAHVHVASQTSIGARTVIQPYVSLGAPPQSLKYRGGATRLEIGSDCNIREGVTVNTGTEDGGGVTRIGDHCFLMAGSHVAHDCQVGDHAIFANNAVIGGHVEMGPNVVLGGQAAVRQFVRIGEGAMVVGLSGIRADLIPFGLASGPLAHLIGLNLVGLRRRGVPHDRIRSLRQGFRALFFGKGTLRTRTEEVAARFADDERVQTIVAFVRARGTRALTLPAAGASADEIEDGEA
jgi:UDP-N-acetylglucosamine acyltransferase